MGNGQEFGIETLFFEWQKHSFGFELRARALLFVLNLQCRARSRLAALDSLPRWA